MDRRREEGKRQGGDKEGGKGKNRRKEGGSKEGKKKGREEDWELDPCGGLATSCQINKWYTPWTVL